jgi:nitroreductase
MMDALQLLHERRSCTALTDPAPEGLALENILRAGMRVPDFQSLHPYEFLLAVGEGRVRLGEMMERAAWASGRPPEVVARAKKMPLRAPLVIVVVARARQSALVELFEQRLSAGCTVMAMQMAAVAQGFGGIWRSGWPMFDPNVSAELGLGADDQIVGFLYLGTPSAPPKTDLPPTDPAGYWRML